MKKSLLLALIPVLLFLSCKATQQTTKVALLIKNGTVYDGIDTLPSRQTIAIDGDQIVYIGTDKNRHFVAKKTIDATGLIVCPGFIDPHTHADKDLNDLETAQNLPFLFQGVTTVVVGNDGSSQFPIEKYINLYRKQGIGTNVVALTGQGTIRKLVIGSSDRAATPSEIIQMQTLVQQEMDAGAFGLSTGLFYAPGSYATTEEVVALAKTVAANDGIYDTHLRDESSYSIGLIPAIEEAITIGRQAHLPIIISHIKCLGVDTWHKSDSIVGLINAARKEGIQVTANQYPYEASATSLKSATIPRWAESGGLDSLFIRYNNPELHLRIVQETKINIARRGGPDKLVLVSAIDSTIVGQNLLQISETMKLTPEQTVFRILKTDAPKVASFNMIPEDIATFMKQDWVTTGSDGGSGHPRKYGTFARKYAKYVKEDKTISIAHFINSSTSKTAAMLKIRKRGSLVMGNYADIIVFDPGTFKDIATYTDAYQLATGLQYSIINGQLAIDQTKATTVMAGKVLNKKL